jgi:hypothetical protein
VFGKSSNQQMVNYLKDFPKETLSILGHFRYDGIPKCQTRPNSPVYRLALLLTNSAMQLPF